MASTKALFSRPKSLCCVNCEYSVRIAMYDEAWVEAREKKALRVPRKRRRKPNAMPSRRGTPQPAAFIFGVLIQLFFLARFVRCRRFLVQLPRFISENQPAGQRLWRNKEHSWHSMEESQVNALLQQQNKGNTTRLLHVEPDDAMIWHRIAPTEPDATALASMEPSTLYNLADTQILDFHDAFYQSVSSSGVLPRDVTVCVVDTGVHLAHAVFANASVTGTTDTFSPTPWHHDTDGHGTHVASIVHQVAPHARLHVVNRLARHADIFTSSDIVQALVDCVDAKVSRSEPLVIQLSLQVFSGYSHALEDLYRELYRYHRTLIVNSAGNCYCFQREPKFPASYPSVMSVAAVDDFGLVPSFSTRALRNDMAAPGVAVYGADVLHSVDNSEGSNGNSTESYSGVDYYTFRSGTSMAAPHVAGAAALLWSVVPDASPAQLRAAFVASAAGDMRDASRGYGALRVLDAYHYLNRTLIDCNDGLVCTTDRSRDDGVCRNEYIEGCIECSLDEDCDDGNDRTLDRCADGTCVWSPNLDVLLADETRAADIAIGIPTFVHFGEPFDEVYYVVGDLPTQRSSKATCSLLRSSSQFSRLSVWVFGSDQGTARLVCDIRELSPVCTNIAIGERDHTIVVALSIENSLSAPANVDPPSLTCTIDCASDEDCSFSHFEAPECFARGCSLAKSTCEARFLPVEECALSSYDVAPLIAPIVLETLMNQEMVQRQVMADMDTTTCEVKGGTFELLLLALDERGPSFPLDQCRDVGESEVSTCFVRSKASFPVLVLVRSLSRSPVAATLTCQSLATAPHAATRSPSPEPMLATITLNESFNVQASAGEVVEVLLENVPSEESVVVCSVNSSSTLLSISREDTQASETPCWISAGGFKSCLLTGTSGQSAARVSLRSADASETSLALVCSSYGLIDHSATQSYPLWASLSTRSWLALPPVPTEAKERSVEDAVMVACSSSATTAIEARLHLMEIIEPGGVNDRFCSAFSPEANCQLPLLRSGRLFVVLENDTVTKTIELECFVRAASTFVPSLSTSTFAPSISSGSPAPSVDISPSAAIDVLHVVLVLALSTTVALYLVLSS